jgi:class 3 adenylate cyclase
MERKLAAIFSADVQGYSRLMGEDEGATIRTLTTYREVMTTLIQQHRGRVVDSSGDNLLAEFASAVDAVQGALAIQRELRVRNAELPDHRKMAYRIGINVGDVIVEGERIYGDGVNIAARLESLAEGGGLCLSGTVYDQIENKLALTYAYLGEQTVKNIKTPVRVYRVKTESELSSPTASASAIEEPDTCTTSFSPAVHTSQGTYAGCLGSYVPAGKEHWLSLRLWLRYLPSHTCPKLFLHETPLLFLRGSFLLPSKTSSVL